MRPAARRLPARWVLLLALAAAFAPASAQPDTTAIAPPADTSVVLAPDTADPADEASALPVAPRTALRRSLLVPGWGQVTNGDYVKAGLFVGAVGGLATLAVVQGLNTVLYRRAAIFADCEAGTPVPVGTCDDFEAFREEWVEAGGLSAAQNRLLRDNARRNRDFLILMTGVAYALQAIDALVSAHLASFDVGEDLSLHLAPTASGPALGLRWGF